MTDINSNKPGTTNTPELIEGKGGGKAYQSVAQSTAIAVQDAVDQLRNISTISTTAIAIALSQLDRQTPEGILELNSSINMIKALANSPDFQVIGQHTAEVLKTAPQAEGPDSTKESA